ncbi:antibiotic biosynthesis monooxygenase [Nocardia sp. CDC159]|uniref:Antibiotic biosynthesis monooxygenase n=1 Tax=Nocardia pulmonis TaxID=2951408 RepID=A0A9X2EDB5_9NOCA|nr:MULTISPECIES: antibiotic biosynthesis monooxygenase family protein [Nocardia]MCM6778812.1 antibiotic biosynthesis monooxygenase [Nocardia pulmonis]MCM6791701.1 antibiotic biosynthesis monooxygenase [Nocardia sp. CDC159]
MILEHALLPALPERTAEFEVAFARAREIIASAPGFRSLTLSRSMGTPNTYLLVEWDRLADHTERFPGSAGYQRWKQLPHHCYEPFPVVEHLTAVKAATPPDSPAVTASAPNPN